VTFRAGQHESSWFWHILIENVGNETETFDLVHLQDVALAPYEAVRTNEYYVSQYLDLTPVPVPDHGVAVAVRQNMPGRRQPWALLGCLDEAVGFSTDALQLTGRGRPDGAPWPGLLDDLPATRLQHEHTLVGLQHRAVTLAPGETLRTGFYGILLPDHPGATSDADAALAASAFSDPAAEPPLTPEHGDGTRIGLSLFPRAPMLPARDLSDAEFTGLAGPDAVLERDPDGRPWAAFTGLGPPVGAEWVVATWSAQPSSGRCCARTAT
jgi:hypothetical protein